MDILKVIVFLISIFIIVFYYSVILYMKLRVILESGRWMRHGPEEDIISCCITDGTTEQLSGKCVIVYRLNPHLDFGVKQLIEVSEKFS